MLIPLHLKILKRLYAVNRTGIRKAVLKLVKKWDGGEFFSETLRLIFKEYHGIAVGLYTHGGCFNIGSYHPHTSFGRYCSIARTARAFNRNHPLEFKSTHAFVFNPHLGCCQSDPLEYIPLKVGSDVWIGHNAIVMPHVESIGHGAVIAAGAVINKNIPPYGVAVGNPARVVRYRFPDHVIKDLLASEWWERPMEDLKPEIDTFQNFADMIKQ